MHCWWIGPRQSRRSGWRWINVLCWKRRQRFHLVDTDTGFAARGQSAGRRQNWTSVNSGHPAVRVIVVNSRTVRTQVQEVGVHVDQLYTQANRIAAITQHNFMTHVMWSWSVHTAHVLHGGSAVGRWTCDLQVAGSIPGRWLSRNIGQLSLASPRGR